MTWARATGQAGRTPCDGGLVNVVGLVGILILCCHAIGGIAAGHVLDVPALRRHARSDLDAAWSSLGGQIERGRQSTADAAMGLQLLAQSWLPS